MPVSPSYRQFVVDSLERVAQGIRAKSMFGGVGLYAGELFFALIDGDTLYLKVDATTRGDFETRGMGPFRPFGEEGEVMQYYELPAELLEEPEELRAWVEKAIEVARRAKHPAKRRKR
ncbi:MAG TPA: TfoX/Sxy family protein [Gemmatimonadales bacterium]|jgi:DNA transformation protein|nr:TfoX/Sxy family protein [Gemmatimonadales bacterium]